MKSIKLILLLIFFINISIVVHGESGSITVQDTTNMAWNGNSGNNHHGTVDYTRFNFYNGSYSSLVNFTFTDLFPAGNKQFSFAHESEYTTFTIISGGTGGGSFSYSNYLHHLNWVFTPNTQITSNIFVISYNNPNIIGNITNNGDATSGTIGLDSTHPIGVISSDDTFVNGFFSGAVTGLQTSLIGVSATATNTYTVSYPIHGYFLINVSKTGQIINTKDFVNSMTKTYQAESTFNRNDFSFFAPYDDGLYLNVTLLSGIYTNVLINASGTNITTSTPLPTPVINPATGKGIIFDQSTYNMGQTANISWIIDNGLLGFLYSQNINIRNTNNNEWSQIVNGASPSGSIPFVFYDCTNGITAQCGTGTYEVEIASSLFGMGLDVNRQTASANVIAASAYIVLPLVVNEGQNINVQYKFGNATTKGYIVDDILDDFGQSRNIPIWYNLSCSPCGISPANYTIMFSGIGKHRVSLYDAIAIQKVASNIVTVLASDSIINNPILNNYFSIDKSIYQFGDTIYGQYQISTANWSQYPYIFVSLKSVGGIEMGTVKVPTQTGSIELPIESSQFNYIQVGAATVNLTAKTSAFNTTTNILASIPVQIVLTKNGWAISVNQKTACNGQSFKVDYTSPTGTGILKISYYTTANTNKVSEYPFASNGSKTIIINDAHQNAGVALDLYDTAGNYQIGTIIQLSVAGAVCPGVTTTVTPTTSIATKTNELLSGNMFIIVVILIIFAGIGAYLGGVVGAIVGFGAGFIVLSVLGVMPIWALFLFAIIIILGLAMLLSKGIMGGGGD